MWFIVFVCMSSMRVYLYISCMTDLRVKKNSIVLINEHIGIVCTCVCYKHFIIYLGVINYSLYSKLFHCIQYDEGELCISNSMSSLELCTRNVIYIKFGCANQMLWSRVNIWHFKSVHCAIIVQISSCHLLSNSYTESLRYCIRTMCFNLNQSIISGRFSTVLAIWRKR